MSTTPQIGNGMTLTSTMTIGTGGFIDFTPDTGVLLKFDGQTILERTTANGGLILGHDDGVIIAGGDVSATLKSNVSLATERVTIGAESGLQIFAFPNNDTSWGNRQRWSFSDDGKLYFGTANDTNLYRSAANVLKTDDAFVTGTNVRIGTDTQYSTGGNAMLTVGGNLISFGPSNTDLSYFRRTGSGEFQWQTYNNGNSGNIHLQPYGGAVLLGGANNNSGKADFAVNVGGSDGAALSFNGTQVQVGGQDVNYNFRLDSSGGNGRIKSWAGNIVLSTDEGTSATSRRDIIFTTKASGVAAAEAVRVKGGGVVQIHNLGAGFVQSDSSGNLSISTDAFATQTWVGEQNYATDAAIGTAISNLVDSSPSALNTLNELAAALGDDANFSTTVTNSIATKLPLAGGTMTGNVKLNDSVLLQLGSGGDLQVYHDGTNSVINNLAGNLQIYNNANDKDIEFISDDGSGGSAVYMFLDGSNTRTVFEKLTRHNDNVRADFGTDSDLRIFHDSSNSYIQNSGTGDIIIQQRTDDKDIVFQSDDGSGGVATYLRLDGSEVETRFLKSTLHFDNVKAQFGDSGDLQIYHDGTDSFIDDSGTGDLRIRSNFLKIEKYTGETMATFNDDNAVSLYYNNVKKFETTSTGVTVTGNIAATNFSGSSSGTNTGDQTLPTASSLGAVTLTGTQTISGAKTFSSNALTLKGHMYFNEHSAGRHYIHFKAAGSTNQVDWRIQTNNANTIIHSWTNTNALFRTSLETTGTVTATGGNSTNWNTAYGWGNHASAGYLTSVTSHTHAATDITSGTLNAARLPTPVSGDWWNGGAAVVGTDGVMEIGKYIDWHDSDTETSDFSYRMTASNTSMAFSGGATFAGDLQIPANIVHASDTNTYFGFHANDQWRVVTGGSERLEVNNTQVTVQNKLYVAGDLNTSTSTNVNYGNINTVANGTVVRGGFLNPASEGNMVHLPHVINDLAGFNHWGTVSVSGLYKSRSGSSGSYSYSNAVASSDFNNGAAFDGYSSTAGSWYSDNGTDGIYQEGSDTPGVITLEWTNEITV